MFVVWTTGDLGRIQSSFFMIVPSLSIDRRSGMKHRAKSISFDVRA